MAQDYIPLNDSCSSSPPRLSAPFQSRVFPCSYNSRPPSTRPLPGSSCWGIWGGIQNPPAAVAFSVSGRRRAALPIVPVVSGPATCAMQPAHRAQTAFLHSLPFNSTLWPGQVFPASTFAMRLRRLGTHIPQVRWLEQFTHEKNLLLLQWKIPSRKKYSLRCKFTILLAENKPIFPAQSSSNLFVRAPLDSDIASSPGKLAHISTEHCMGTESSILGLLILGTSEKELIESNFSNSHILPGNFKWVFNIEAWLAACESREPLGAFTNQSPLIEKTYHGDMQSFVLGEAR